MPRFFLNAKPAYLFCIFFIIPFFVSLLTFLPPLVLRLCVLLPYLLHFLWLWCVITHLYKKIPVGQQSKLSRFKRAFILLIISSIVIYGLGSVFVTISSPYLFVLSIVVLIAYMYGVFATYFNAAKIYKAAQQQKIPSTEDILGSMFLFFTLPLGIWFIQPQVKLLLNDSKQ